jgi:hypothetical protein
MGRVVVDDVRDCRVRHTSQLGYLFECRGQISSRDTLKMKREHSCIIKNWPWFWERSQSEYTTNHAACQQDQIVKQSNCIWLILSVP